MSIPSELCHLAVPINFLAVGKNQLAQASFEPRTCGRRVLYALPLTVLQGIGFGTPSQRQSQYEKYRVWKASENVSQYQIDRHIGQAETSVMAKESKAAKRFKTRFVSYYSGICYNGPDL